jgi:hypothetical protein
LSQVIHFQRAAEANIMSIPFWRWSIVLTAAARLLLNQAGAAPLTIGIVLPQGQPMQSADVAEPLRQSLIGQLQAQSIDAVPLSGALPDLVTAEAQSKHCSYVLYTHLEKHSSSGLRGKLSGMTNPFAFTAFSAKGANTISNNLMQGTNPGSASQPSAAVKQGDTMTMAYRLTAVGSTNPVKADSFDSGKAGADGQDLISPLVTQVTGAVGAVAHVSPATAAQGAPAASPAPAGDPAAAAGHSSVFGSLFGHHSTPAKPAAGSMNSSMDCAKIASMPVAPMSMEACEKIQSSQQIYNQAASDPAASRPGDDQMTCPQITAELKQQQYTAPDKTKAAEALATANKQEQIVHKEHANMLKMQAEDQKAIAAATAADDATELATAGLVQGRALNAVEKTLDAKHKANNDRVIREDLPVTQQLHSQTAGLGADFAQQLQSNPRLARLMQLADSKHCKGGT